MNIDNERKLFERWFGFTKTDLRMMPNGEYLKCSVQDTWKGFAARAALLPSVEEIANSLTVDDIQDVIHKARQSWANGDPYPKNVGFADNPNEHFALAIRAALPSQDGRDIPTDRLLCKLIARWKTPLEHDFISMMILTLPPVREIQDKKDRMIAELTLSLECEKMKSCQADLEIIGKIQAERDSLESKISRAIEYGKICKGKDVYEMLKILVAKP